MAEILALKRKEYPRLVPKLPLEVEDRLVATAAQSFQVTARQLLAQPTGVRVEVAPETYAFLMVDGTDLIVMALVGEAMEDWVESFDKWLEEYARSLRLTRVIILGRLGWKRVLEPYSYKFDYISISKEV